jgi:acetylornithine deacetylase/succinyl-diaminopimelate desuccinylase-like protein
MVYGVFPFPATDEEFMTIHGGEERIRIPSLRQGTEWLHRVVKAIAAR